MSTQYILEKLDSSVAALKEEIVRLQKALDDKTGKIQEPVPYPIYQLTNNRFYKDIGKPTYSSWGNNESSPTRALAEGKKVYEESKLLVENNVAICAQNKIIIDNLIASIANAGLPDRMQLSKVVRGKMKIETVTAAWKNLGFSVKTSDTWPMCESSYRLFVDRCNGWQKEIDDAAAKKEQANAQDKAKIEAETKRIQLCLKYELDPVVADTDDILEKMFKQSKYLMLGHYLQANRNDWSEGPDYAERGMNQFTAENETDEDIIADIQPMIDDWDGDGRCFRDTTWNYGALFNLAPVDLYKDYCMLGSD